MALASTTPKRSPWGTVQQATVKAPGIVSVSTAGHGGFKLDRARNALVHAAWRRAGGWYEEDCEWAIVACTFALAFSPDQRVSAHATAKDTFPDAYQTVFGVTLDPSESYVLRERAARDAARGKLQIVSCWGAWANNVPPGMVGVYAVVNGRDPQVEAGPYEGGYFLITDEQYREGAGPVRVLPADAVPLLANGQCPFYSPVPRDEPRGDS